MKNQSALSRARRVLSSPGLASYYARQATTERLKRWWYYRFRSPRAYPPQRVALMPTSRCNLNCISCNIGAGHADPALARASRGRGEIGLADWKTVIDKLAPFRPMFGVTGGEPLLHRDSLTVMEYIKGLGLYCSCTTNATLLDRESARRLVVSGLDLLVVSFDGLGETHDRIRGVRGAFDKALAGVKQVLAARGAAGRAYPLVHVNSVMSPLNQGGLVELVRFFADLGVDGINLSHVWSYGPEVVRRQNERYCGTPFVVASTLGGEYARTDPTARDLGELWEQLQRVKRDFRGQRVTFLPDLKSLADLETFYLRPEVPVGRRGGCVAPWTSVEVYSDGGVEFADSCFHIPVGNLVTQEFAAVWNGEAFARIRRTLKEVGRFPVCSRCCYAFYGL